MKYLIPLLFLLSCVPEQKRNAEITTMYNGVVEFHANPEWDSEDRLRQALTDGLRPDFIIFSADWCEACHVLRDVIVSSGWRSRVIIINMDEKWVRFLAKACDISAVPSMIVTFDDGGPDSGLITGAGEIGKVLFEILENKK